MPVRKGLTPIICLGLLGALTLIALGSRFFMVETAEVVNTKAAAMTAHSGTPGITQGPQASQFCNLNPIQLNVSGGITPIRGVPYPSLINVSGMTGVVNSVTLTLRDVHHSWGSDIDILLVSPDGRKFIPMSDIGGQTGFTGSTTLTLADAGTADLFNVALPIPDGTYRPGNLDSSDDSFPGPAPAGPHPQPQPVDYSTFANVFNNTNPNGNWQLYVVDDSSAAGGTIGGWCLDLITGPPLASTVQFSSANFDRASDTTASITVLRPNTSAGAITVDYSTVNGTATPGAECTAGVDYVPASGTLSFANGEPSKTIGVTLCRDTSTEPVETFNVVLSNPTGGATLGSPGTSTVSIHNGPLPCDVVFRRVDSPHVINTQRVIFADQVACVEPGSTIEFSNGGKMLVYGEFRAIGTASDRITIAGGKIIDSAGAIELDHVNAGVIFNISNQLTARNTNFVAGSAITSFFGITAPGNVRFVKLENVLFDSNESTQSSNAQLFGNFTYLQMKDVTFRNRSFFNATLGMAKFQNVRSENSAYEGLSFGSTRIQPLLLENINVSNCARGGLDLFNGNYFLGSNVAIQNCEYPITGRGGIVPGSVAPLSGNRNNWIEMGDGAIGGSVYADAGIPYVIRGFVNIGGIDWQPGVVIKARPDFAFNTGGGSPLNLQGLPGFPITLEPLDPAQKWVSGQFNSTGDRIEYAILDGVQQGMGSPEGTGASYYVDNSIIRNNTIGFKDMLNSNAPGFFQSNLFTNNQTAIVAENARIKAHFRSNPNLFENNIVAVSSISVPDIRNAWWNSPTGPTTSANPGGTGDRINGGARFRPFLTSRPDTEDHPPVVRLPRVPYVNLYGAYQGMADAGTKITLKWDAFDDHHIVKQKILFSPSGNSKLSFTKIADDLPPDQRSFEFTVPSVGFVQGDSVQFVRVVAVDDKGQEGWEDWQFLVPSGEITGDLTITANVAGRTFHPGDEIPFTFQINQGFPLGAAERFIIFDADRTYRSFGANTIATMPPVSTDTARLMVVYSNSLNQQKFFFSEPFSVRFDPRFPDAPPEVAVTSPAAGQQFNAGDVIPIQWTGSDDELVRYYNIQTSTDGGRTWIQTAEMLSPFATSYNWKPEIRGAIADVRVRVIAVDSRFQNTSATRTISINSPANQPPTVQVTYPANGGVYTVGQATFIAANANDPDGTIQRVEFYAKGSAFMPAGDPHFIGSDTTAPYQVPWIYPAAQGYVVTARAYDNRNRLVTSQPINVTFNPFNPAPLPIGAPELTTPVDGDVFPAPATITLEALPAPTIRNYVRVEFYNGTTLVGTDTTSPYTFTLSDLTEGKYTFFVKAVADNNAESISGVTDVTVGRPAVPQTPFDFDGDSKADASVFRPLDGVWHLLNSSGGYAAHAFGLASDVLAPADYDGDGKYDLAVYRDGTWYVLPSSGGATTATFGLAGDVPQPGDYDHDGKADLAVFRPSNGLWYIQRSSGGIDYIPFGVSTDRPVSGDYDGDGKRDVAIFRPESGQWWILRSSTGSPAVYQFGVSTDRVVAADYTGDGKTDSAVWRPSTGEWFVLRSEDNSYYSLPFGQAGDVPAPADFDGDGKADLGIFRQGVWYQQRSTGGVAIFQFGLAGDIPVPR